jgi:hypothetical protein
MPKRIALTFKKCDITAIAELLEEDAPHTCCAIWQALETPVESKGVHAMFAGREVNIPLLNPDKRLQLKVIPPENQTVFPLPGEILWHYFPPHSEIGSHDEAYNVSVVYGRDTRMFLPTGWVPHNVFARIIQNLDAFAGMCRGIRTEGPQVVVIKRVEEEF